MKYIKFNRPMTIRVTIDTSIFSPFNTYEVVSDFCRLQLCNEKIFMTPKFRLHPQNSFHQFDFCEILDNSPYKIITQTKIKIFSEIF